MKSKSLLNQPKTNTLKAIGYVRVSTDEQAEEGRTSIPYQKQQIQIYCHHEGYELLEIIEDAGYSGTTEKRPGLIRLRKLIQERAFDILVVYDSSRLARNPIVKGIIKAQLQDAGIKIKYIAESYDESNVGEMSEGVMDWVNWFLAKQTAEKVYNSMRFLAEQGKLLPSCVQLGYDWSEVDENGHKKPGASLVKNEEEAKLVQLIFDLYERMSQQKVARWLNEQGYRFPCKLPGRRAKWNNRTERFFQPKDIHTIISNELYVGMVVWGKTTTDKRRQPEPQTHWFPELQIISFEQFNRVQKIKEERKKIPIKSVDSPYIYSGILRCPYCGGRVVGKRQRYPAYGYVKTKRYECRNYHAYGKAACKGWAALERTVTRAVIPFLADLFENKLNLKRYVEEEAKNMAWEEHEGKARELEAEIEAAKATLKRTQRLAVEGILTPEEAKGFVLEAREKIERTEKKLQALKEQTYLRDELTQAIHQICTDVKGALEKLNEEALRAVVRQVFKSFTIGKRGHGPTQKVWIQSYEFQEEFKQLLAQELTIEANTPA